MKKIILPIMILVSLNLNAQIDTLNQIIIANAGEVLESDNYILNFTLGEFAIKTLESNETILSQGFHQTDSSDLITVTTIEIVGFENEIIVYPNPTQNLITIKVDFIKERNIEIQLIDALGRNLRNQNYLIKTGVMELDLTNHTSGIYYINIKDKKDHKKQSIKIIKS